MLNLLGELALASAEFAEARHRHEEALAAATEVASALDEARALEGLGRCYLADGQAGPAAARLRQALEIYQRIGSQYASRVEALLNDRGL